MLKQKLLTVLLAIWSLLSCNSLAEGVQAAKPNIVIFFVDDLGYTDPVCYRKLLRDDEPFYETPTLNRLASRGAMFTSFYSAHPVCSPTRAALMSGKAPQRVGITQWISQPSEIHLPLKEITIGEAFSQAGYQTGYIGKWHLGDKDEHQPDAQGFGWQRAVNRAGQPGSYFHPFERKNSSKGNYWNVPDLDHAKPGDYLTDQLASQATQFIESNKDDPFLLCLSTYSIHTPIQAPKALVEKYKQKRDRQFKSSSFKPVAHTNETESRAKQDNPTYAAMLESLDQNVDRVLKAIDKRGLTDNTIVVFTSDNGGLSTLKKNRIAPTCVLPLRAGKGWCYEGGIRVPAMIVWPGKIEPSIIDSPAITMDLYPTLLDLAGLEQRPAQHLDGISLVDAMKNPASPSPDRVVGWHYPHAHGSGHTPSSAIRYGNWKLISRSSPNETLELYDLASDIGESKDLSKDNPAKAIELNAQLKDWLESTTR